MRPPIIITYFFPDDYGHSLGCYADVLSHFDAECSGRRSCKIHIGTLDSVAQPCPKDFKSYLEASFLCVPGMNIEPYWLNYILLD